MHHGPPGPSKACPTAPSAHRGPRLLRSAPIPWISRRPEDGHRPPARQICARIERGPPRSGSHIEPWVPHHRPFCHRISLDRRMLHAQARDRNLPSRHWPCSAQLCTTDSTNKAVSVREQRARAGSRANQAGTCNTLLIHMLRCTIGLYQLSDASLRCSLAAVACTQPRTCGGPRPRRRVRSPGGGWPGPRAARPLAPRASPHGQGGLWSTCSRAPGTA